MNSSSKLQPHKMTSPTTSQNRQPRARRMMLSLLLCLVLLFATAFTSTPSQALFECPQCPPPPDWTEYLTYGKTATQPGLTSGARETVVTLSVEGTAPEVTPMVDVVLVLDSSLSMNESEKGGLTRIQALKNAAKAFAHTMLDSGTDNRIAVVAYGTSAYSVIGFSSNVVTVKTKIDGIGLNGYTNMHDGILKADTTMLGARPGANKVIVFMSDGVPNRFMDGSDILGDDYPDDDDDMDHSNYNQYAAEAFQEAADDVKEKGITILTVGLFQDMENAEKDLAKANLKAAASTGGDYEASTPASLTDIYTAIGVSLTGMVGDNVMIHDYVPLLFEDLDEATLQARVNGTLIVPNPVTYDPVTRTILWDVGTFNPGTLNLSYKLTVKNTWYGALYTNRNADDDAHGAYMDISMAGGLGNHTIWFDDPDIRVRPYAKADAYITNMDTVLAVPVTGLLLNDDVPEVNQFQNDLPYKWGFPDAPRLRVDTTAVTQPAHGTLVLDPFGSFTYTPTPGFHGVDTFEYRTNVLSWEKVMATTFMNAPLLAAGDAFANGIPLDGIPAPEILASDPALVTINVLQPEQEPTRVLVQKYIGETNTVSGPGFSFEVHPDEMILYDDTPTVYPVGPTNESGLAFVDLPDGMYVLVEKDLVGYTNDLGDGFHFMVYGGTAAYPNEVEIPNNTIIVHNIPDEIPTPTPTPTDTPTATPTPVPTSPPSPTDPPTPSTNVALIVEVVGPGTALPFSGAYGLDSVVQLTATPNEGAVFTGWTGPDGGAVDGDNRIVLSTSRHVIANFEIPAPPPTPTPEPEPDLVIPEPVIPEGPPEVEAVMMEETIPQAAPILPQTAGFPLAALLALGITALGTGIWRKKK